MANIPIIKPQNMSPLAINQLSPLSDTQNIYVGYIPEKYSLFIYIYPHEIAPFTHKETRPNPQLNPQSNSKFYIVYLSNIVDL